MIRCMSVVLMAWLIWFIFLALFFCKKTHPQSIQRNDKTLNGFVSITCGALMLRFMVCSCWIMLVKWAVMESVTAKTHLWLLLLVSILIMPQRQCTICCLQLWTEWTGRSPHCQCFSDTKISPLPWHFWKPVNVLQPVLHKLHLRLHGMCNILPGSGCFVDLTQRELEASKKKLPVHR